MIDKVTQETHQPRAGRPGLKNRTIPRTQAGARNRQQATVELLGINSRASFNLSISSSRVYKNFTSRVWCVSTDLESLSQNAAN